MKLTRDSDETLPEWAVLYFGDQRTIEYFAIPCKDSLDNNFYLAGALMRSGKKEGRRQYDPPNCIEKTVYLSHIKQNSTEDVIVEIENMIISKLEKEVYPDMENITKISAGSFKSNKLKLLTFKNKTS